MAGINIKGHPALISVFSQRLKKLTRESDHYLALCPFHDDHHPSLNVGKDDKGDWVFHCFACGASGDAIKFVQDFDKLTFAKAKKLIEDVTGGDWEESKALADKTFQKIELASLKPARRYPIDQYAKFEIALYESKEAKEWLFRERGITYETARKLNFGYCNHLSMLNDKYNEQFEPVAAGGRILTPAVEGNEVVCIEARSMQSKVFARKGGMENKCLFGVDFIDWSDPVYVVEGHFDQAVMIQAGFRCVSLPSASVNMTPQMRDILMSASVIILAGDNDGGAGSNRMLKLWNEFQERTFNLVWPDGKKDANEVFLETSKRDIEGFRKLVDTLTLQAYSNPMPGVQSLQDILLHDDSESAADRPDRFISGWKGVDEMANILPGSVTYVSATDTGTGKTQWTIQATLNAARKHDEIVLNYQTQLEGEELGEIVTAHLLAKDRNEIKKEDRLEAAKRLRGVQYYVGNNPNLSRMNDVMDLIEAGVRRVGATVVVLDLIHSICMFERDPIKAQEQCMNRIKRIAQKYLLKFFVVGQPRKQESKNQGKPLQIYDSKGSEAIPSESDVIFYLHRDTIKTMTEDTFDRLSPELQVRCMKGRRKGKGSAFAKLMFLGKICTFMEITNVQEPAIDQSFDF